MVTIIHYVMKTIQIPADISMAAQVWLTYPTLINIHVMWTSLVSS